MAIDISKLFSDITGPANTDLVEGEARLSAMDTPGGMAALLSPQRARAMRQGLGGLFGQGGGMTPQEQVPEAMRGLDINDPDSIKMVIRKLNAIGATREASQLKLGLDQLIAENALVGRETDASEMRSRAARDTAAFGARNADTGEINAQTQLGQLNLARQEAVRNQEADAESTRQWNIENERGDMFDFDPNNSTPRSMQEYREALRAARNNGVYTPAERQKAIDAAGGIPRPHPGTGWVYKQDGEKTDAYGNPKYIKWPDESKLLEVTDTVRRRNIKGTQDREAGLSVVNIIGRLEEKLDDPEFNLGVWGIVKSFLSVGSPEYEFRGDLGVILANMGYTGLMDAKDSSETGASGFGQLTAPELLLLTRLQEDLSMGLNPDTFKLRLNEVEEMFQLKAERAKSNWDMPQVLGLAPETAPDPLPKEETEEELKKRYRGQ